jgi:hypothetical protein
MPFETQPPPLAPKGQDGARRPQHDWHQILAMVVVFLGSCANLVKPACEDQQISLSAGQNKLYC